MAKISIKAGTTSKLVDLFIQDSSSTVGAGLGSIAYNTSGLTAYYYREGAASSTAITLATMTLGTWATGGFVVVDGTNMLGAYQLALPDAAIAAGAKSVMVYLKGVTNMAPLVLEIELTAVDNQSASSFITAVNGVAQTGDTYARLGAPAGASVSADVAAVQAKTTNLPAAPASTTNITAGTITTVTNLTNAPTAGDLTAAMSASVTTAASAATPSLSAAGNTAVWATVMTGTTTAVQAMRGFLAVLMGKASGLETTTAVYRDVADTKPVITATVDANGNRTAVTRDLT